MFDIIQSADMLFGAVPSSCKEIIPEFNCEYRVEKNNLPSADELMAFLGQKPERDRISITITSDSGSVFVSDETVWMDSYTSFVDGLFDGDEVVVVIRITKDIQDGTLSVYDLKLFSDFLCNQKMEQFFENFTKLFADCGEHIAFQLLDTNGSMRTSSISFSDNDVQWINCRSRKENLRDCEDASVFLDRMRISLIPQDFDIDAVEGSDFEAIKGLFQKLRTVLSYIYLANTATVVNDKTILQFDPSTKGYEYEMNQLTDNMVVPLIYEWVFKDDSCVDKASIARKIINTYCRDRESILTIDEKVLNSIKSDYVIYQKNHADQYIDMKNKISEFIVDSAGKIQELSHDIADAFRNNFVAIIVFLMTVLLTDSIDFTQFFGKEISPKVTAVCAVFTVATLLYFIATLIMENQKWIWLKQSYTDLKKNYDGVFDSKDLDEAFNHDEPLKNAEEQYKGIRKKIGAVWIGLILVLAIFTSVLVWQGNHVTAQEQTQVEDTVTVEDSGVQATGVNNARLIRNSHSIQSVH